MKVAVIGSRTLEVADFLLFHPPNTRFHTLYKLIGASYYLRNERTILF